MSEEQRIRLREVLATLKVAKEEYEQEMQDGRQSWAAAENVTRGRELTFRHGWQFRKDLDPELRSFVEDVHNR